MWRLDRRWRRIGDLKTSERRDWKEDFSRRWWGACEIGAELQIVWSCLSRTSRCRVLSAALCPGECFPVRMAEAAPQTTICCSGEWTSRGNNRGQRRKGGREGRRVRSEPVQSDLAALMSLIVLPRPHRRRPSSPPEKCFLSELLSSSSRPPYCSLPSFSSYLIPCSALFSVSL